MRKSLLATVLTCAVLLLTACAIQWATIIATAEAISQLVVVADPSAAKVAKISQMAVTGLQVIEQTYNAYESDKTGTGKLAAFEAAVLAFQQNLPAELAAAQISNPTTKAAVTAAVNIVLDWVDALAGQVPQLSKKTAANRSRRGTGEIPSKPLMKSQIVARWKTEVCRGDSTCAALVH